jgi:transposase
MDAHKCSTQLSRLEVVETGRRRRWSDDEKLRIVLESMEGPRLVAATARRHGISRALLLSWRRTFGVEAPPPGSPSEFVPATIVPERPPEKAPIPASVRRGRMVIVLATGQRVVVDADVDGPALARVLDVLERR